MEKDSSITFHHMISYLRKDLFLLMISEGIHDKTENHDLEHLWSKTAHLTTVRKQGRRWEEARDKIYTSKICIQ
jgi:hypothetical protein